MPTPTYDLIEEKVLGSAQASVTFSSIPGTYKDLVLEIAGTLSAADTIQLQLNGDTTSNYSDTRIIGNGTNATSDRHANQTGPYVAALSTSQGSTYLQIMSYTSTNVYKTILGRSGAADLGTFGTVSLWRKTPEAVTSIKLYPTASNFATSCTFRLWGVSG